MHTNFLTTNLPCWLAAQDQSQRDMIISEVNDIQKYRDAEKSRKQRKELSKNQKYRNKMMKVVSLGQIDKLGKINGLLKSFGLYTKDDAAAKMQEQNPRRRHDIIDEKIGTRMLNKDWKDEEEERELLDDIELVTDEWVWTERKISADHEKVMHGRVTDASVVDNSNARVVPHSGPYDSDIQRLSDEDAHSVNVAVAKHELEGLQNEYAKLRNQIVDECAPIVVHVEVIVRVAKKASKSTSPGLSQITPYEWRIVIEKSERNLLAESLAKFATRMCRDDFPLELDATLAAGCGVPLAKDAELTKHRPVVVGSALIRLLLKASVDVLRKKLDQKVDHHQYGVKKAGYEIAAHSCREMIKRCIESVKFRIAISPGTKILCMLFFDAVNAFNAVDQKFMLHLLQVEAPGLLPIVMLFYVRESQIHLNTGETILSSDDARARAIP